MQMSTSSLLDELSLLSSSYKTRTSSVNSRLKIKAFLYEGGREGEREGAKEGGREVLLLLSINSSSVSYL